jgi:hypothetical protein
MDHDMDIPIILPLDSDGFLRRACPNCEQQFKWHHGPANAEAEGRPAPTTYYCPLCGRPAAPDSWWTRDQLEFAEGMAAPAVLRSIESEFAAAFRGMDNVEFTPGDDSPDVPASLTETDDMQIVTSPCHAYEPIKVAPRPGPFHCLVCGAAFAV